MHSEENKLYHISFKQAVIALLIIFSLSTCKKENMCDCLKGTGKMITQDRAVAQVSNFRFGQGKMNCFFTQDSVFSVRVEAGKHLINLIKTEVIHDTLVVSNDNVCNFVRSYKPEINIYITTPKIHSIKHNGTGKIFGTNTIHADSLTVETWSSGDIIMDIDCNYLYSHLHEGTALYLSGKCVEHSSQMWHNSTLFGNKLITDYTYVYQNTSGNFYCNVTNALTVVMVYSGNVIYSGSPSVSIIENGGNGKVMKE